MWLVVIIGMILVAGLIAIVLNLRSDSERKLTKAERKELYELRSLVARLDEHAFAHRELDAMLAPIVIDEIRKTKKTLG